MTRSLPSEDESERTALDVVLPTGDGGNAARRRMLMASAPVLGAKVASSVLITVVTIVTARALGPSGRGVLVLLMTVATFTSMVGTLGVNLAARIRMVSPTNPVPLDSYLGLSLVLTVLQIPVAAGIGAVLLPLTHVPMGALNILLVGLYGGATVATILLLDALFAFGKTTVAAVVDAVGSGSQLGLVVIVAVAGSSSVSAFLLAMVAGAGIQAVVNVFFLGRMGLSLRPRFSRRTSAMLVKEGYPAIGLTLGQALTFRVDRYIAAFFVSPAAVGIYSVAASGSEMLRLAPYAVSQVLFHRTASDTASSRDMARVRRFVITTFVGAAALVALAAPVIVRTMFGSSYMGAVTPLRILLLAEVGMCLFSLDAAVVAAGGGLNRIAAASLTGLVVVGVFDVLLIPRYGIVGAAWASVIAYWVMGLHAEALLRSRRRSLSGEAVPTPRS